MHWLPLILRASESDRGSCIPLRCEMASRTFTFERMSLVGHLARWQVSHATSMFQVAHDLLKHVVLATATVIQVDHFRITLEQEPSICFGAMA